MQEADWRELYKLALLEVDPILLPPRIEAARGAVQRRLRNQHETLTEREWADLENALRMLRYLAKQTA
jgi:hypothetical protein